MSDSLRPMDCILPGSSVHGIFQERILEWVAISYSWGSSWPRDWTHSPDLAGRFSTTEPSEKPKLRCCSGTQSCPTLCDPMDCSTLGFPVRCLPELAQTHVHQVGDAILPSHHLSSPSPHTFSLSQHQGLFQWVSSSHQVARELECQLQHVFPMNIHNWFYLGLTGWISLPSKRRSRVFSNTTVQKHQFLGAQRSL